LTTVLGQLSHLGEIRSNETVRLDIRMLRDNQSLEDRKCVVGIDASEEHPAGEVELDGVELVLAGGVLVDLGSSNIGEMV
jgi:hypothetical protein